jgi:hypothetical protein
MGGDADAFEFAHPPEPGTRRLFLCRGGSGTACGSVHLVGSNWFHPPTASRGSPPIQSPPSAEDLPGLRPSLRVAEEVGARLGARGLLQRALPPLEAHGAVRSGRSWLRDPETRRDYYFCTSRSHRMPSALVWFRNDLRTLDHEPLTRALADADRVIPVYCLDPRHFGTTRWGFEKMGAHRALPAGEPRRPPRATPRPRR